MEKLPGARCDLCPLQSKTCVRSKGLPEASIAFVGEAPGAHEVMKGRPFVGPSGQLLRGIIEELDIDQTTVCTFNTISCGVVTDELTKDRAASVCVERLVRELAERKPHLKTVVALGNYAIRALIGGDSEKGVTKIRGRWYQPRDPRLEGILILPVLHPAAVLRNPDSFRDIRFDIEKATKPIHENSILRKGFTYEECLDETSAGEAIADLARECYPAIALDLETSSLDKLEGKILCIVLCPTPEFAYVIKGDLLYHDPILSSLKCLLTEKRKCIVAHNAKFDMLYIWQQLGFRPVSAWDTMLMHYTADEMRGGHDLKELSREYFDAPDYDEPIWLYTPRRSAETSFAKVPWSVLAKYNAQDGIYTMRLWIELMEQMTKDPRRMKVYNELLRPALEVTTEMERHGVWVDMDHLDAIEVEYEDRLNKKIAILKEMVGDREFNPASSVQVGRYIYDVLGLPVLREWGRTTQYDCIVLMKDKSPFIAEFLEYRSLAKIWSTYIEPMADYIDRDGRVRPDIALHGTSTGRLVMKRPALMTTLRPGTDEGRDIRNLFGAPPGKILVEADYSQNELRVAAALSQDPYFLDIYGSDRDLHTETSMRIFGNADGGVDQRHSIKRITFGLLYGRGAESLMTELRDTGWSMDDAREYIRRFYDTIRVCVDWIEGVKKGAVDDGYVESVFGRRRNFPLIVSENRAAIQREAANFHPQSVGSDLCLIAMVRAQVELKKRGWGEVILMIHDSLVCEVDEARAEDTANLLREIMIQVPKEFIPKAIPWKVDTKIGTRWGALG